MTTLRPRQTAAQPQDAIITAVSKIIDISLFILVLAPPFPFSSALVTSRISKERSVTNGSMKWILFSSDSVG